MTHHSTHPRYCCEGGCQSAPNVPNRVVPVRVPAVPPPRGAPQALHVVGMYRRCTVRSTRARRYFPRIPSGTVGNSCISTVLARSSRRRDGAMVGGGGGGRGGGGTGAPNQRARASALPWDRGGCERVGWAGRRRSRLSGVGRDSPRPQLAPSADEAAAPPTRGGMAYDVQSKDRQSDRRVTRQNSLLAQEHVGPMRPLRSARLCERRLAGFSGEQPSRFRPRMAPTHQDATSGQSPPGDGWSIKDQRGVHSRPPPRSVRRSAPLAAFLRSGCIGRSERPPPTAAGLSRSDCVRRLRLPGAA